MPVLMPCVFKTLSQSSVGELFEFKHGDGTGLALVAGQHQGKFYLVVLKSDAPSLKVPFVLETTMHHSNWNILSYGTAWSIQAGRPEFGLEAGHIKETPGGTFFGTSGLGMCVKGEGFGDGVYINLDPVGFASPPNVSSVAFYEWEIRLDEPGVRFKDRALLAKWEYKPAA